MDRTVEKKDSREILEERASQIEKTEKAKAGSMQIRFIAVTGILAAVSVVLQSFLAFPIPIMPSFIEFDLSDLPALIGSFAMGPVCGVLIELIKNLFHSIVTRSFGVGEISNFILGAIFVGVAGLIYKYKKSKKGAILGAVTGAVAMAVLSFPTNLFVVYPSYYNFFPKEAVLAMYQAIRPSTQSIPEALLVFNAPFTLVKGLLNVGITMLIYKPLSPILHGRHN